MTEGQNQAVREILGLEDRFNAVSIKIASPEVIRSWSHGEVKNPETINYRTFKPEKGGLFCEKIFGPTRDWECRCGKYKRVKHKGIVCDRCGVEVTHSRVRRERMGHIELAVPVTHVWFFKVLPSRLSMLLNMTIRNLERVIYYDAWVVTDPGDTPLQPKQVLTEDEYRECRDLYGDSFQAGMGGEAIQELLKKIDLDEELARVKELLAQTSSKAEIQKLGRSMRLLEGMKQAEMRPEWMVLTVLPVIPPELRPLVPLEGGRFATYDLNDLYRRVINRNNRLKNLLQMHTPEVIVRNEKRMLQEAVDALLDNGRHGRPVTGSGNRPLKSLADMLKGKQGRFRQNLLGKRVDYSGRSVIVVGPELKLHQAGLPKKMALTLFEPFIIRRMRELGYIHTVRSAKKMIERGELQVWDILDEVTKGHPILLNRAPTLHRLSIQAFEPVLIEGNAIRLHPLVCTAYNADFDGDQMAVHVPLSNEAQLEASMLMLSTHNIFYPSNGKPICTPTQDIVLGCYYLCFVPKKKFNAVEEEKLKRFSSIFDVISSFERGIIDIHEPVLLRNPDYGTKGRPYGDPRSKWIKTTAGRCVFNELWPRDMGFYNDFINKSSLGDIISAAYARLGRAETVKILDELKDRGYFFATRSGFSIGITDMVIPDEKERVLRDAEKEIEKVRKRFNDRVITEVERYNQSVDIWTHAGNSIANALFRELQQSAEEDRLNPVWAMLDSKARGSRDQIRQLAGMRGLMAKPSGDIIEHPIRSCFREGLSVLEFFISSHGARKGLADTALKTADSGYLTRKLVDVAHDVICVEEDCHTTQGITVSAIREGTQDVLPLKARIVGRFAADDIVDPTHRDPSDTRYLVMAGEEITPQIADKIIDAGIERVTIRSVLTCRSKGGVCAKCYGRNLASDVPTRPGDAIGIIAAQSIGEPGTQLTMRTFHVGGVAHSEYKIPQIKVHHNGILKLEDARYVTTQDGKLVVLNKSAILSIVDKDGIELESHNLVLGAIVQKDVDSEVSAGEVICVWDPYNLPIISEFSGTVSYIDLVEGATTQAEINEATGKTAITVLEHREDLFPQIAILDDDGERLAHYNLPPGTQVMVEEGQKVSAGDVLARTPRQSQRTRDITGGLPRVSELFEARKPKDAAEIAKIDGIVRIGKPEKGKRRIVVKDPETGISEDHVVPTTKHITVYDGDFVRKGQPLTNGSVVPQEILEVCGRAELQEYLVNEVQQVYRLQGVEINDKHIEVIVRQMLQKVRIIDPGDTGYLPGEQVDQETFLEVNARTTASGGRPGAAKPVLLGITKAALETESFISAASFQDTTRILTAAASLGKVDYLRGFKENVILGHLIPAGTGYRKRRHFRIVRHGREIVPDLNELAQEQKFSSLDDSQHQARKQAQAEAFSDLGLDDGLPPGE